MDSLIYGEGIPSQKSGRGKFGAVRTDKCATRVVQEGKCRVCLTVGLCVIKLTKEGKTGGMTRRRLKRRRVVI